MIYIGSDHGGYDLKEKIKEFLGKKDYQFDDKGNLVFDKDDDYPYYAFKVAKAVAQVAGSKGILLCRSSGGVVIAANKVKGVRAVSASNVKEAKHAIEHNDANIIALPGDWITEQQAFDIVITFIETDFPKEERHLRRINMIKEYEK